MKLTSAKVEVEVEVETEHGNLEISSKLFCLLFKDMYLNHGTVSNSFGRYFRDEI